MSDQPVPPFKFDRARLTKNDQITGLATVVLFISLFLPWFGVNVGVPGLRLTFTASGLSAHGYLYIVLILCIALVGYLVVRAGMADVASKVPVGHELMTLVVTAINLFLVLLAFLFKPGGSGVGWRFGSFVGLIAALVAVAPLALPAIQARRAKG
ncbi:MAG TPA: hypothetical protein VMU76_02800 [Acidimicrobiales bacterium]|nr:hypothetical protein [Acidimicrobiales bacterium]